MGASTLRAALAAATLTGLQVLLPRVFSIVLWYHLGFLAVSLAMLGLAAGGTLVARAAARTGTPGGGLCGGMLCAAASAATGLALVAATALPIDPTRLLDGALAPLLLFLAIACLALPFVLLGAIVAAALDAGRVRLGALYGATFAGGAAGAGATLLCLELGGTRAPVALLCALPLLGALLPTAAPGRARRPLVALALLVTLALALAPRTLLPLTSRKHFPRVAPEHLLEERSDATSHILFYENVEHHGILAQAPGVRGPPPESVAAAIDAWAITFVARRDGPGDLPHYLAHHTASLAYVGAEPGFDALVLGAGGGWDVLGALAAGAGHVTAVEINPLLVEAVRGRWGEWSGSLYDDPRVEVHVAEGRDFVERDERRYDRIVLAGVDTFGATQAGAFALAENYLYTVEACETYLRRLKPGGRLFFTRWWFEPPRQTLRLVLTLAEALRRTGVADPRRRLFVAVHGNSLTVVKAGEDLSPHEQDELREEARARGATPVYAWEGVWATAQRPNDSRLVAGLDAPDPAAWAARYPYRVEPTTDDRPFFFEHGRLGNLFRAEGNWIHDRLGGQEVLLSALAALLLLAAPLLVAAARALRGAGAVSGGGTLRMLVPFALLGFGYLLVEVPLLQRLSLVLGHPVRAVAVVLVALLLWSGLGSALAGHKPTVSAPARLLAAALAVAALLALPQEVFAEWVRPLSVAGRSAAVVALLAIPGALMGAAFPASVATLGAQRPLLVPSAWVWNGAASVLAGPLAVLFAMSFGFRATLLLGAGCYAAAALVLRGALNGPARDRVA